MIMELFYWDASACENRLSFLCFLFSYLLSSAVLFRVFALKSPAVFISCWNSWAPYSFVLLWCHSDQCWSEGRHAAVSWKYCRDRREGGERGSARFRLKAFLICLWSAHLWQPAIHDMFLFSFFLFLALTALVYWPVSSIWHSTRWVFYRFSLWYIVVFFLFLFFSCHGSIWMERIMFL